MNPKCTLSRYLRIIRVPGVDGHNNLPHILVIDVNKFHYTLQVKHNLNTQCGSSHLYLQLFSYFKNVQTLQPRFTIRE